jgi:hypothetical protein
VSHSHRNSRTAEPDSCCSTGWAVQEKAKRGFLEDLRIGAELATTAVFDAVRGLVRKVLFMPEKRIFSPLGFDGRGTGWVDDSEVTVKTQCATWLYNRGVTAMQLLWTLALCWQCRHCHKSAANMSRDTLCVCSRYGHWTYITPKHPCSVGTCYLCQQFHVLHGVQGDDPESPPGGPRLRRTNSFSDWESLHNVWTAAEVIKAAGYPLEQHTVTTSDGYILRMERLPRHGTALLALLTPAYPNHTCCTALQLDFKLLSNSCCIDPHQ